MEVKVYRAKLTPNRSHITRAIVGKWTTGDVVPVDQHVLYTPPREHESPASKRKRTMRFRRREEHALSCMHNLYLKEAAENENSDASESTND